MCAIFIILLTCLSLLFQGLIGKDLPEDKILAVNSIFDVLKNLVAQFDQGNDQLVVVKRFKDVLQVELFVLPFLVSAVIQESAVAALILLGEKREPRTVIEILKTWRPNWQVTSGLERLLRKFFETNS